MRMLRNVGEVFSQFVIGLNAAVKACRTAAQTSNASQNL